MKSIVMSSLLIGVATTIITIFYGKTIGIGASTFICLFYALFLIKNNYGVTGLIVRIVSIVILSAFWSLSFGYLLVRYILKI